jgi:hypothetical protein
MLSPTPYNQQVYFPRVYCKCHAGTCRCWTDQVQLRHQADGILNVQLKVYLHVADGILHMHDDAPATLTDLLIANFTSKGFLPKYRIRILFPFPLPPPPLPPSRILHQKVKCASTGPKVFAGVCVVCVCVLGRGGGVLKYGSAGRCVVAKSSSRSSTP